MTTEKKETSSENNDGVTSIAVGKPKVKSIKWSPENELIMVEWCDIAQCYKWLHMRCHTKLSTRHAWFTIPAIALSTISGTASFAQTSLPIDAQVYAPMAIGTINILIGISTTIQQYLKISELNESHRVSGISWDKFARNIRIELAKDPQERMDAGQFLKICRAEFDRLMETSPNIDNKTIKEFHEAFKGKETEEDRKRFEEQQQERFKELRKPDICNVIISSNESRHHWYKDPERLRMFNNDEDNDLEQNSVRFVNFEENVVKPETYDADHHTASNIIGGERIDFLNQKNIKNLENLKTQKQRERKIQEEFEKLLTEQTKILNEYVDAFVEALGRNPNKAEIELNMKDNIDPRVMENFFLKYNLDNLSVV